MAFLLSRPHGPGRALRERHLGEARRADNGFVSSKLTIYPGSSLVKIFFHLKYYFLFIIIMSFLYMKSFRDTSPHTHGARKRRHLAGRGGGTLDRRAIAFA